ncbi:MAG: hypothetical protein K9J13_17500 [Saprospiraceae bacterium]|nr:hypothetical protein [Saprospiraceae bacterium]
MRVLAIECVEDGVMKSYGEGEYLGDKVPDISPWKEAEMKNPCIKLDSGKYVWGFQCWWGKADEVREKYFEHIKEEIIVDIEEEIFPV